MLQDVTESSIFVWTLGERVKLNQKVSVFMLQDVRFQFMNTIKVAEKPLNLTYIHMRGDNRTIIDGSLVIDPANKLSANYMVGTTNCKLKYTYVHGGMATFEPCYDLAKNVWDFAVSRKLYDGDNLKATYQTSSKMLGLEWSRNSKSAGSFKVNTCVLGQLIA